MFSRLVAQFVRRPSRAGVICVSDPAVRARIALAGLSEFDLAVIVSWRDVCEHRLDQLVDEFVALLLASAALREVLEGQHDAASRRDVVRGFLHSLVQGRVDDDYAALRACLGRAHGLGGVDPGWFVSAYQRLHPQLVEEVRGGGAHDSERELFGAALWRLIRLDIGLVRDAIADGGRSVVQKLNR